MHRRSKRRVCTKSLRFPHCFSRSMQTERQSGHCGTRIIPRKKCKTRISARGAFFSSVKELFHLSFLPSVKRFSEARIFLRRRCRTDGNFPLPSEKLKRTGSDPVRFTVDRDLYSNMISREPRLFSPASLTPIAPGSVSC